MHDASEGLVAAAPIDPVLYAPGILGPAMEAPDTVLRNRMIASMILDSAEKYRRFQVTLGLGEREVDTFFDFLTVLAGGAGAAFTHAAITRPLAATAAISTGTKSALDADIYAKKTAPTIVAEFQHTYRDPISTITGAMVTKTQVQWPAAQAAADVVFAHSGCSLDAALAQLNIDLGQATALLDMKATLDKIADTQKALAATLAARR